MWVKIYKTGIISQFLFGSFDGTVSVLGVIIGLAAASSGKIVAAAIGLAAAAAISMGFGEFLGDNKSSILQAITMGIATLFGTLVPILPFIFLSKTPAFYLAGALTLLLGIVIGYFRDKGWKGYIQTILMLIAAVGITIAVTLLIPGAGR